MSRIGKQPIPLPKGVEVVVSGNEVSVKGPLGSLRRQLKGVTLEHKGEHLVVNPDRSVPNYEALWGLMRTLVANMVKGVSEGFTKVLRISGTGYRVEGDKKNLTFYLGYSHPIPFPLPEGLEASIEEKQTRLVLKGIDKEVLGNVAAQIRRLRPADPYKAKGITYEGEKIRRKEGKKTGTGGKK